MARKPSKEGENAPLDKTDKRILDIVDDLHKKDDPMPPDLNDRVWDSVRRREE